MTGVVLLAVGWVVAAVWLWRFIHVGTRNRMPMPPRRDR